MADATLRRRRDEMARKSDAVRQLLATDRAREAVKKWDKAVHERVFSDVYKNDADADESLEHMEPPMYKSMDQALTVLKRKGDALRAQKAEAKKAEKLDLTEIVTLLRKTVAMVVTGEEQGQPTLLTYDYDEKIYTYSEHILAEYIAQLTGNATQNMITSVSTSLLGFKRALAAPIMLPDYKIAVGNGVYNCLTGELEEPDPRFIVTEKIDTDYVADSYDPNTPIGRGRTFSKLCAELANFEPDRVQLLHQICKAIITGHSVAPALFIIVGRGGDGKSTFFQLMVNTVGEKNSAFVNFDEITSDDKMAETINKKLVLGMDNNANTFLRKTALLKSIASHEYITHSRKYERAKSVPFTGSFIQLCNELPRFAETGDSIRRRVVCFHAENSHYKMGTEDRTLSALIEDKSFREHILYEVLNEERCAFYNDFNDVDRGLIESSLDNEDVLSQFIDEMKSIGVFTEANSQIPTSHLYAAYRDWMKVTSPTSAPLSSLSFSQRIAKQLDDFGYEISQSIGSIRPSSLEKSGVYSSQLFASYASGEEFQRIVEKNTGSRVLVRVREPQQKITRRRGAARCSAMEFFGEFNGFLNWVKTEDPELYGALNDPLNNYGAIDDSIVIESRKPTKKANDDESTEARQAREQYEADIAFRRKCQPPIDLRSVRSRDPEEWRDEYDAWLEMLGTIEPANDNQAVMLTSVLDQAASFMSQVANMESDGELSQLAESVANTSGSMAIRYAREFVKGLAELHSRD